MKNLLLLISVWPLAAMSTPTDPLVVISDTQSSAIQSRIILPATQAHKNTAEEPDISQVSPSSAPARHQPGVKGATAYRDTRAYGSFSVPYTSKSVSHLHTSQASPSSNAYLSATYPYRAIGKLTFNADGYDSFCSATLIRRGVIVTAAHCIQDFGAGDSTYTDFQFTPASYKGSAPYGTWSARAYVWPRSWSDGSDVGSGAAVDNDLAVIVIAKNAAGQFIGDLTGYLNYGWNNYSFIKHRRTGNLWVGAITTLGYPGLLDNGGILQRTDGPAYLTTISRAGQIYQGSNLTGGSSGGPWIANFGYGNPSYSSGASAGKAAINNVIVGVTSWGSSDPNVAKDNYASQFRVNSRYPNADYGGFGGGNIGSLVSQICNYKPDDSTQSFKDMGYCD